MSVFEKPERMPPQIAALQKLSVNAKKNLSLISISEFDSTIEDALKYLDERYKTLFKRKCNYTNEHIAETVFECFFDEKQIKPYIKCSWQSVERFLERSCKEIKAFYLKSDNNNIDQRERLQYFWEVVADVILFLSYAESTLDKNHKQYGFGKRNIANSSEIFIASIDHLKRFLHIKTFSDFIRQPTATFLLRQAIELRIKNALGVYVIFDSKGNPAKISPDTFIDFIYDNAKIEIPIKKSILRKIHSWTNYYIHGGILPELWKIELAQFLLADLFSGGEKPGAGTSVYGSIQIDKTYYENQIHQDIIDFIITTNYQYKSFRQEDFLVQTIKPEALLV